jgi:hypothetical protein
MIASSHNPDSDMDTHAEGCMPAIMRMALPDMATSTMKMSAVQPRPDVQYSMLSVVFVHSALGDPFGSDHTEDATKWDHSKYDRKAWCFSERIQALVLDSADLNR